jgi:hypothetical protein
MIAFQARRGDREITLNAAAARLDVDVAALIRRYTQCYAA